MSRLPCRLPMNLSVLCTSFQRQEPCCGVSPILDVLAHQILSGTRKGLRERWTLHLQMPHKCHCREPGMVLVMDGLSELTGGLNGILQLTWIAAIVRQHPNVPQAQVRAHKLQGSESRTIEGFAEEGRIACGGLHQRTLPLIRAQRVRVEAVLARNGSRVDREAICPRGARARALDGNALFVLTTTVSHSCPSAALGTHPRRCTGRRNRHGHGECKGQKHRDQRGGQSERTVEPLEIVFFLTQSLGSTAKRKRQLTMFSLFLSSLFFSSVTRGQSHLSPAHSLIQALNGQEDRFNQAPLLTIIA
ncbi:hypothetical protein BC830DRAFT_195956 [Chytriomyces sp. MP71]|nr:hypothetical protein BC830DRAFT_195956 [Chytriomyces sp. MP71]